MENARGQRIHKIKSNGLTHFVREFGADDGIPAFLLHGFPDTSSTWTATATKLADAGRRVFAPDLRGFGESDAPAAMSAYDIETGAIPDLLGIMDALNVKSAHIVGHDFGAPVGWGFAALHPTRTRSLAALSVGHPRAFLAAGAEQRWRSLYILFHQFRGIAEAIYKANNWAFAKRHWNSHPDVDGMTASLGRPGRLTAGLNWYRANAGLDRLLGLRGPIQGDDTIRVPTLGVWSDGDVYLTEAQMTGSEAHVDAPWRYLRISGASHWVQADEPGRIAAALLDHWLNAEAMDDD